MYEEDIADPEQTGFLTQSVSKSKNGQYQTLTLAFFISLSLNVFLLFSLAVIYKDLSPSRANTYQAGFQTDLEPVKPLIELVRTRFTSQVELQADSSFAVHHTGGESIYVDRPSPDVDHAWYDLLAGLNIDLETDEVDLTGQTMQWADSGRFFSGFAVLQPERWLGRLTFPWHRLEMYHSLHCLNRLRQALHPTYYTSIFDANNSPGREAHIGHCINHLRQAIQCHADLTPMQWDLVGDKIILRSDTLHTCRNFDKIHAWATRKSTIYGESIRNGSLAIVD
ncbi:hypothetical protein F5Y18DRAFT_430241 [Xylariaceae sp. FL1019]|nr:hypothetical protein F5Y18DRAFT_430241 [Xylariaceae sp. FL1019]